MRPSCLLIPVLLTVLPGCRGHRTGAPDWARSAPPKTALAFSGRLGWLLSRPDFQEALRRFPMAEQTLDLFLKKARIAPERDPGRLSIYVLDLDQRFPRFLIQLADFQDPAALQQTVVATFPAEGSWILQGRELPLHVLLDVEPWHIRALLDDEGRVWIGDLVSLETLKHPKRPDPSLIAAASWMDPQAPLQGFLRPDVLMQAADAHALKTMQDVLPRHLDALAWSVTPSSQPNGIHRFTLCITGGRGEIQRATPWVQRFAALVGTTQHPGAPSAEMIEEPTRIGLRAQLTGPQLEDILRQVAAPAFRFGASQPSPSNP